MMKQGVKSAFKNVAGVYTSHSIFYIFILF